MIKCIMFDLSGVVTLADAKTDDQQPLRLAAMANTKDMEKITEVSNIAKKMREGRISVYKFEEEVAAKLGLSRTSVHKEWEEFSKRYIRIDSKMVALLKELKKRYTVALLSNMDRSRYAHFRKALNFSIFDYVFVACYIKKYKPGRDIYEYVLKKMHLKSNEVLFVDDRMHNIEGARAAGMNTIHFKGREDLINKLKGMHLL